MRRRTAKLKTTRRLAWPTLAFALFGTGSYEVVFRSMLQEGELRSN